MDNLEVTVPAIIVNQRSDVDAKRAFVDALTERGFDARVTRSPADITAYKSGQRFYFEIKKTGQSTDYFGAATLTEWEVAVADPEHFFFVTAQLKDRNGVFHDYTPDEFIRFSSMPPFKVFFHMTVGPDRTIPTNRASRAVPLTTRRVAEMVDLYRRWQAESRSETGSFFRGGVQLKTVRRTCALAY